MRRRDLEKKIGITSFSKLYNLERFAKSNGLIVKVRAIEGSVTGDFTIFIYDKNVKKSYMVGFDGCFDGYSNLTFEYCINQSLKWIKNYLKK